MALLVIQMRNVIIAKELFRQLNYIEMCSTKSDSGIGRAIKLKKVESGDERPNLNGGCSGVHVLD